MIDNKLGITDGAALAREEERISKKRARELFEDNLFGQLEPVLMKDMLCIEREIYKLAAGELWEQKDQRGRRGKGKKSIGNRGAEGLEKQRRQGKRTERGGCARERSAGLFYI